MARVVCSTIVKLILHWLTKERMGTMAYGGSRRRQQQRGGKSNFVRVTGLFSTKRDGMWTGKIEFDRLLEAIDAVGDNITDEHDSKYLTFCLFENDNRDYKYDFNLVMAPAPAQQREQRGSSVRASSSRRTYSGKGRSNAPSNEKQYSDVPVVEEEEL